MKQLTVPEGRLVPGKLRMTQDQAWGVYRRSGRVNTRTRVHCLHLVTPMGRAPIPFDSWCLRFIETAETYFSRAEEERETEWFIRNMVGGIGYSWQKIKKTISWDGLQELIGERKVRVKECRGRHGNLYYLFYKIA